MNIHDSTINTDNTATLRYSDIVKKLIALGLSPLPVAPYQDPNDPKHKFHKYLCLTRKESDLWEYSEKFTPILEADGRVKPKFTGKNPSYLQINGFPKTVVHKNYQGTLPTQVELAEWFGNPKNGIGCLGNNRYRWLDLDRKHFDSQEDCDRALDTICAPDTRSTGWLERTQSGGYRMLVDCGEGVDFTNFALTEGGDHVGELLGAGRFAVLAPSIGVSGNPYTNISYGDPIPLSELNIFTTSPKKVAAVIKPSMPRIASSDAIELFSCITPAVQSIITGTPESDDRSADVTKAAKELYGWENWLNANQITFNGSADNLINDCGDVFGIDSDRIERIKKSINSASCLPACVILSGDDAAIKHVKKLGGINSKINPQDQDQSDDEKLCKIKFLAKKINDIYGDRFKLNLLRSEIELDGEIFDLDQSRYFFGVNENLNISKSDAIDIVRAIAIKNQFHPVKEYLESCAAQYPKSNILDDFALKVFGTSEPIYSTYIKKMLVGAVARIFKAGVKNDTCLILQGKQGSRKSSFFNALGGEWFTDNCDKNLIDKDNLLRLHRHWIIELGEIDRIVNSRHEGELKRFLSSPSDVVRRPYERMSKELDRGFIFVGSTNRDDFLSDATGDRRFWVIPVNQNINTEFVAQHRNEIWAAAVALYRSGYAWHLNEIEDAARQNLNERYRSQSPWHSMIESYLEGRERTSTNEIIAMIQPDVSKVSRSMQREIADILTTLGWGRNGLRHRAVINGNTTNMLHSWVSSRVSCSNPDTEPTRTDNEVFGGITEVSSRVSYSNPDTESVLNTLIPSESKNNPKLLKIDIETCKCENIQQEKKLQMFEAISEVSGYQNPQNVVTEPILRDTFDDTFVIPSSVKVSNPPITLEDDDEWLDIDSPVVPTKKALKAGDKVRYVGQKFAAIYGSTELIVNSVDGYEIDCKLPDGRYTTKFKIHDRDLELVRASEYF